MFVDATDLENWADRRDAQDRLPQLLRRLVHATVNRILRIGFPAGEGVQLGGWDGIVVVEQGNPYVPNGTSAWELGTNKDIKGKAHGDYTKRLQDPRGIDPAQSTFVFVTPRRWVGKDDWVTARRAESMWRDVRAYDADSLEEWLELAPAVHIWLSILLGTHPEDAMDLGNWWDDWSATTQPATSSEFVLSGRSAVVESVHGWFRDPLEPLALKAESREEALAVFAAALQQLPADEQVAHLSRAVVVRSLPAWHRLTSSAGLILVPAFDSRDAVARATRTGHRVVIPLGRADSASAKTINIPRLSKEEAVKVLVASDIPEDRARDLAALARKSFTSFRRKLALAPEVHQPEWARPAEARSLLPAMLAGAWDEDGNNKWRDREAVAALAQVSYEQVKETLVRWSHEADAPVRRVGDAWFIVSKEDAWSLLARYLIRDDLERLQGIVIEVLGTPDPRYDLPAEQRWMAEALGHAAAYSRLLREGLADTLAIMGARGDTLSVSAGVSARNYATRIVRRLLESANTDWRLWASLSPWLPLLAEAAPDAFLSAVEQGLAGEPPLLLRLFTDQQDVLFGDAHHTGLLWALEALAWSPEHLGRAALLLAKLARIDPGGRVANRPPSSLRGIFLLWHPQTMATLDQRLRVLDMLREHEPEVAWRVLRHLIPENHEIGHNTHMPRWREWTPDTPHVVSRGEFGRGLREVAARLLADVSNSGSRWQDLIEALPTLPGDQYDAVVGRLESMDVERLQPSDRAAIWNALCELISRHRSFPDAGWALPKEHVDRLDAVFRRFESGEAAARYRHLFASNPALPEWRGGDWRARQEAIDNARLDALRTVYAAAGLPGVVDLVGRVEQPGDIGFTLGRSELASAEEDGLLRDHLGAEDRGHALFARGFAVGRIRSQGREWAERKLPGIATTWSPAQRAELLYCLPCDARTWEIVEASDPDTNRLYWRLVPAYGIADADVERALRKFLEHGRPYAAITLLASHATDEHAPPPGLIADALEQVLQPQPEGGPGPPSLSHDVSELLDVLAGSQDVDEQRIARLEWAFLSLLGRFERPPKLLHRELARNPDFFVEIIDLVFRAEGEEPRELTSDEKARVQRGYELLDSWRTVPGIAEDGSIDAAVLREWVERARTDSAEKGLQGAGDRMIGKVLSASPGGPDGTWPHHVVRDIVERTASVDLERGFETGVYNSRGTVTKDPFEGGAQERQRAERYAGFAAATAEGWPRTAAMLRRIAEGYRADALREDQRAELRQDLNQW